MTETRYMMPGHSAASCARGQGGTRCSSPLLGWASKFRVGGVGPGLTVTYLAVGEGIWIARGTKSREKHEIGHRFRGEGPFPCSLHRAAAFSVVRSGQGSRRRRTGGAGEGCEPSTAAFRVRSGQGPRRRRWGGIRSSTGSYRPVRSGQGSRRRGTGGAGKGYDPAPALTGRCNLKCTPALLPVAPRWAQVYTQAVIIV